MNVGLGSVSSWGRSSNRRIRHVTRRASPCGQQVSDPNPNRTYDLNRNSGQILGSASAELYTNPWSTTTHSTHPPALLLSQALHSNSSALFDSKWVVVRHGPSCIHLQYTCQLKSSAPTNIVVAFGHHLTPPLTLFSALTQHSPQAPRAQTSYNSHMPTDLLHDHPKGSTHTFKRNPLKATAYTIRSKRAAVWKERSSHKYLIRPTHKPPTFVCFHVYYVLIYAIHVSLIRTVGRLIWIQWDVNDRNVLHGAERLNTRCTFDVLFTGVWSNDDWHTLKNTNWY